MTAGPPPEPAIPNARHVQWRASLVVAAVLSALGSLALPALAPAAVQAFTSGAVTLLDVLTVSGILGLCAVAGAGLGLTLGPGPGLRSAAWSLAQCTRAPRRAALVHLVAAGLTVWATLLALGHVGFSDLSTARWLIVGLGLAFAEVLLALATALPLGWREPEARKEEGRAPVETSARTPLLVFLREQTPYRGQLTGSAILPEVVEVVAPGARAPTDALAAALRDGFARAGTDSPRADQRDAAHAVLEAVHDCRDAGAPAATRTKGLVLLQGHPGAGRRTAALAAANVVVHGQGGRVLVVRCDPEAPLPRIWAASLVGASPAPGAHLVATGSRPEVASGIEPVLVEADVEGLVTGLLPHFARVQPGWLFGVRLVVILHPDRADRATWLHLHESLARLRALFVARGADVAMAAVVRRTTNAVAMTERLCSRTGSVNCPMTRPAPLQFLAGWLPPAELLEGTEYLVRSPLDDEVASLLVALGAAGAMGVHDGTSRPTRVLANDSTRLLRPEAVEHLRERMRGLAGEWAAQFGKVPGDLLPDLKWSHSPAPVAEPGAFDVVVLIGPGPAAAAEVAALRGAMGRAGHLLVVAAPRPHDVQAISEVTQLAVDVPVAGMPPGADRHMLRHKWLTLLHDLRPGTLLTRSEIIAAWQADAWEAIERLVEDRTLPESMIQDVLVRDHHTRAVRVEPSVVRPEDWPVAAPGAMPWGCWSGDRRHVLNTTAVRREVGDPATIDFDRLFYDWLPGTLVRGVGHSLAIARVERPEDLRDTVRVSTPDGDRAREPVLFRPYRTLTVKGTSGEETRVDIRGFTIRVGSGEIVLDEDLLGTFRTQRGLNPDRRLLDGPELFPNPVPRSVTTQAIVVDVLDPLPQPPAGDPTAAPASRPPAPGDAAGPPGAQAPAASSNLSEPAARALLNAWCLDREARFTGFSEEVDAECLDDGGWPRWVLFRRFPTSDPLDPQDLAPSGMADFTRIGKKLLDCHCDDGCVLCCARLGDVPVGQLDDAAVATASGRPGGGIKPDALGPRVSRRAAVAWLRAHKLIDDRPLPDGEDRDLSRLERLRTDVLGRAPQRRGGWMEQLLGDLQVLPAAAVAEIQWMSPADVVAHPTAAGLYHSGRGHVVKIRPNPDDDWLREVIIHEYTHNWQFISERFARPLHMQEAPACDFFSGNLVIEGHATWVDTMLRVAQGKAPAHRAGDAHQWNEYKSGYLLIEWIARTYGVVALYTWLAGETRPEPRVRGDRAPWPLSLEDAIRLCGHGQQIHAGSAADSDAIREAAKPVEVKQAGAGRRGPA